MANVTHLPGVLSQAQCDHLRHALQSAGWQPYALADRGRYQYAESPLDTELQATLVSRASQAVGRPLALFSSRALSLGHRDYVLVKDDDGRLPDQRFVDVTVDVSEAVCPEALIVYSTATGAQAALPSPGDMLICEREVDGSRRYERYLNHRVETQRVVRLRLLLI